MHKKYKKLRRPFPNKYQGYIGDILTYLQVKTCSIMGTTDATIYWAGNHWAVVIPIHDFINVKFLECVLFPEIRRLLLPMRGVLSPSDSFIRLLIPR